MSTRSRIAIENQNGSVTSIYCHFDGYIDSVGKTLFNHYDQEKLEKLLELGDISSLGESTIDTVAYCRDRGEDLKSQSFKEFEVVVSDHSLDSNISNLCNIWNKMLNIKYIKNERGRGSSSANINTAIQNASNNIVKIIFQDDYLIDNDALLKIHNAFLFDCQWLIHSTNVTDENMKYLRTVTASWNNNIVKGRNTIGAPSAIAIRKSDILFDENLIWLMDCDFYHRYYLKYGLPLTIREPLGAVTQWSGTLSSDMPQSTKDYEFKYITKKYDL